MKVEGKLMFINPTNAPKVIMFYCPGCKEKHGLNDRWQWNGDTVRPTFTPSALVQGTKMTPKGETEYEEWCNAGYPHRTEPFDSEPSVCHSWVINGKIQYLNDCHHELRGQTVDLPEMEG